MISKEFHRDGHLRTGGNMNCNKCGAVLTEEEGYSECIMCGPVCNQCSYGCFEKNEHCRSR